MNSEILICQKSLCQKIADMVGPMSAAQLALASYEKAKAEGHSPVIIQTGNAWKVIV